MIKPHYGAFDRMVMKYHPDSYLGEAIIQELEFKKAVRDIKRYIDFKLKTVYLLLNRR